ncbi:MAG TPA: S8 family peptidase [Thermoanaerobaculia bacterium]|nr:S8 family peptidase [Thermoanaerobaculia bacterium]
MKNWILAACTIAFIGIAQPANGGQFLKAQERGIPDRYLVVLDPSAVGLKDGYSAASTAATERLADAINLRFGADVVEVYGQVAQFLIEVPERIAMRVAQDPRVLLVEQDAEVQISAIPNCYGSASNFPKANSYDPVSPQAIQCWDPQLSCADNWGLDRIGQRTGSQNTHTLDAKYSFSANGQGTHIYILDSGIVGSHTEFALPFGGTRIGNGTSVTPGEPSWDTYDYLGHGTHVASIAAGRRFGVAKAATLHPVKFSDRYGNGTISAIVNGIDWIVANVQRPAVVNMSFNAYKRYNDTTALDTAVDRLIRVHSVPVVNSAGNWNVSAAHFSPTAVPQVIVAAGLDWFYNQRWGADPISGCHDNGCGSNWGSSVDLYAPATDVLAALGSSENNLACTLTGTSMAAAHVSGVVAQYLQTHPNATPLDVENILISKATTGVIQGNLGGSPNRLLFTDF